MLDLSEIEHDALTELVNLGVGRAATNLGRMVRDQVQLSVPRMDILSREGAAAMLGTQEPNGLVAVGQDFQGAFSGRALLIFPEANSLELVRAVLDSSLSLEEIVDLEQEALAEIGNVILNGCLVVMANTLRRSLTMSLPTVLRGDGRRVLLDVSSAPAAEHVMFLYIDFAIRARNIRGYIALLMDLPSIESVKTLIHEYIAGLDARPAP